MEAEQEGHTDDEVYEVEGGIGMGDFDLLDFFFEEVVKGATPDVYTAYRDMYPKQGGRSICGVSAIGQPIYEGE